MIFQRVKCTTSLNFGVLHLDPSYFDFVNLAHELKVHIIMQKVGNYVLDKVDTNVNKNENILSLLFIYFCKKENACKHNIPNS